MKDYRKELTDQEREQKIEQATEAYSKFMDVILPGWQDDPNSKDTPHRVSKMYINELYAGLYGAEPKITVFDNVDKYDGIVFEGDISLKSQCSHHNMPFFGKAFVAYIAGDSDESKIIGLSKLNRIIDFFSRRPQVQENLTMQIHSFLDKILVGNKGVAVYIEAQHTCVSHRGAKNESVMKTAKLSGYFWSNEIGTRREFYSMVENSKK